MTGPPSPRCQFFTAAVLGTDGSGKSTLAADLARSFSFTQRTCLIGDRLELFEGGEPQPLHPLLSERIRRWMNAGAKHARSLAGYKIPKLAELLLRDHLLGAAGRSYHPDSVIMDGMPLLNLCAWSALYRPDEFTEASCAKILAVLSGRSNSPVSDDPVFSSFPELKQLRRLHRDHLRVPDAVIFLDVPPTVCMERISSRGEALQVHETEEKLKALRRAYLLVCSALTRGWLLPVLVLDGDRCIEEIAADAGGFIRGVQGAKP